MHSILSAGLLHTLCCLQHILAKKQLPHTLRCNQLHMLDLGRYSRMITFCDSITLPELSMNVWTSLSFSAAFVHVSQCHIGWGGRVLLVWGVRYYCHKWSFENTTLIHLLYKLQYSTDLQAATFHASPHYHQLKITFPKYAWITARQSRMHLFELLHSE